MKDERVELYLNTEKEFKPCMYCEYVYTDECIKKCAGEMEYKEFKLQTGTGIKDLPAFPLRDMVNFPDPHFRLIVLSIYITAITDYLQHEEEYRFREEAPEMENKWPKGFKLEG